MKVKFFSNGIGDSRIAFKVNDGGIKTIELNGDLKEGFYSAEIVSVIPEGDDLKGKTMITQVLIGDVYSYVK